MSQWHHKPVSSKNLPLTTTVLGTKPALIGVAFMMHCSVSIIQLHLYQNLAVNWVVWEQGRVQGNHFCDMDQGRERNGYSCTGKSDGILIGFIIWKD